MSNLADKQESAPCSALGSREALGSSNNIMPTEESDPETNERMNVRELVKKNQHTSPGRSRRGLVHCKPLHLSTTEARNDVMGTPGAVRKGGVDRIPMGHRLTAEIVLFDVGVESAREVVDELFCAGKTGGFADLVAVICECRVAKCDVLVYLHVS